MYLEFFKRNHVNSMRIETLNPVSGIPALLLNFKFGIFVSEIFTRFEILVIFFS